MEGDRASQVVVMKLGGSVFPDEQSYRKVARFLERRLRCCSIERLVVVVSAQKGYTDALEHLAQRITGYPNPRTLDLLWSTGETRSVALLTLHLEELGIAAVGLNAHETGLRFDGEGKMGTEIKCLPEELRRACRDHSIVVVPGFFATLKSGTVVSMGRGGSDLTAVLLAEDLEAKQCELIKDVPGYFTQDPNVHLQAEHLPWISYDKALEMAKAGCDLLQQRAIEAAYSARVRLVVRSLDDDAPTSVVSFKP